MTLSAGTRLGPYEILAPLGAGGMGEVYRARDRKLDRDVAVKVLPESVAADLDTLARFEREAKAVAALSHPNILSIFDFGAERLLRRHGAPGRRAAAREARRRSDHPEAGRGVRAAGCPGPDVPGLFWPYLVMASACGHLGRRAEAAAAVRDLLALDPEFAAHARANVGTWHFASGLMEPILEGLRKAGLSIPATDG